MYQLDFDTNKKSFSLLIRQVFRMLVFSETTNTKEMCSVTVKRYIVSSSITIVYLLTQRISCVLGDTYGSKIKFYNGDTVDTFTTHRLIQAENVVHDNRFNLTRTTMIFIHGWNQSPTSLGCQVILNAYISNGNYNILMLDWSGAAGDNFIAVQRRVNEIGIELALFIDRINKRKGFDLSKLHLVGHSLGAHLAGKAGKYTMKWSGKTKYIDRITGLDPANFYSDRLNRRHARFVDIIHTNAGGLGMNDHNGHVDFFPNAGISIQPGCPSIPMSWRQISCSHVRSIQYWAESVQRGHHKSFLSVHRHDPKHIIQMGNNCPTNVRGVFDLTTRKSPWYSKS